MWDVLEQVTFGQIVVLWIALCLAVPAFWWAFEHLTPWRWNDQRNCWERKKPL